MLSDWTKTAFKSWIRFEREKCSDCLQVMHYAAFWEVTCKFQLHSAWKRHIWEMIKGQGCWTPFVTNSYSRISQILDCSNCNHFDSQVIFFFTALVGTPLVWKAKRPLCLMFLIHYCRLVDSTIPIFRMMRQIKVALCKSLIGKSLGATLRLLGIEVFDTLTDSIQCLNFAKNDSFKILNIFEFSFIQFKKIFIQLENQGIEHH